MAVLDLLDYSSRWAGEDIAAGFARRAPWVTRFCINGEFYGGEATVDARLSLFDEAFSDARSVLELGSLDGGCSFALAERGLRVTAVEGRLANISRARWVQQVLGQRLVRFHQADLQSPKLRPHGVYDVVFCSGRFYPLPDPSVLLDQIGDVADGVFLSTPEAQSDRVIGVLRDMGFPGARVVERHADLEHGPCVTLAARRPQHRPTTGVRPERVRVIKRRGVERSLTRGRRDLARHVWGHGLELMPSPHRLPLPIPPPVVRLVELPLRPEIVGADNIVGVADGSEDFVIASHIIESVADPLRLLDEIHRVLRPGGVAVILLPDRRAAFEAPTSPTPLAHVIAEHGRGASEVDADHLDVPARAHCWTEAEFSRVLAHAVAVLGHGWELVECLPAPLGCAEFGWVLRRGDDESAPVLRASRLVSALRAAQEAEHG